MRGEGWGCDLKATPTHFFMFDAQDSPFCHNHFSREVRSCFVKSLLLNMVPSYISNNHQTKNKQHEDELHRVAVRMNYELIKYRNT